MQFNELIQEVIFYSIANSFVVFGVLKTLKRILEKRKLHRFVSIGITYILGIIMGFMLKSELLLWEKIIFGFFIGSCSVAVYKSAIKTLLDIVPSLAEKFIFKTK